jgi:hypothetical protein
MVFCASKMNQEADIPVTFQYNGKTIVRFFTLPLGSGGNAWHLYVQKYHWGRLYYRDNFDTWDGAWLRLGLQYLKPYFIDVILAWHQ